MGGSYRSGGGLRGGRGGPSRQLRAAATDELGRKRDPGVVHKLVDVAVVAPALRRFQNQTLVVRDGDRLLAEFLPCGVLERQQGLQRHVGGNPIVHVIRPQLESGALERDENLGIRRCR